MRLEGLSNLLSHRFWAVDPRFAESVAPGLLKLVASGKIQIDVMQQKARKEMTVRYNGLNAEANYASTPYYVVQAKNGRKVAIIPVIGSLTKRGEMCSYGMRDFSGTIAAINEIDGIDAIILDSESPGGTVDGTPEFGLAVKTSKKPVGVFGDSLLASAGMWFASQARFIMGNKNNPTEFGSIGTLYVHVYAGKYIEDNIGEIKIIRAPQSDEKARVNELEPLEPEQQKAIEADLKAITDMFIKTVKKGRGSRLNADAEGLFNGRMFSTDEAIDIGLIDYKGTLMDAVNKAAELAANPSSSRTSQSKSNMKMSNAMGRFFGKSNKATTKAKAETPAPAAEADAPAEPKGVAWAEELVFNTDGSGDGSVCNHPDSEGNIRNFETKIDNNTGNEPPTDPEVTEDDNWIQIADEETSEEEAPAEEAATPEARVSAMEKRITALEAQAVKATAQAKKDATIIASLKRQLKEAKETTPAAAATKVSAQNDKGHEYQGEKKLNSWEKKQMQVAASKKK